jgi:hypothetical protein
MTRFFFSIRKLFCIVEKGLDFSVGVVMETDKNQKLFVEGIGHTPEEFVARMRREKQFGRLAIAASYHDGVKELCTDEEKYLPPSKLSEVAHAYFVG